MKMMLMIFNFKLFPTAISSQIHLTVTTKDFPFQRNANYFPFMTCYECLVKQKKRRQIKSLKHEKRFMLHKTISIIQNSNNAIHIFDIQF